LIAIDKAHMIYIWGIVDVEISVKLSVRWQ
jgi:hypothetical protein